MAARRGGWASAGLSGILLALAFPLPDLHALVWVALVPVVLAARNAGAWRRWWLGFVAGFVWRVGSLYWIAHTMVNHGGMPMPVGAGVAGLLAMWMALNTGLVMLLAPRALRAGAGGALVFAAGWVSLEYLQTLMPFGFPWSLLGYAAGRTPVMMQSADLAGVWGLSFAAVLVNVVICQRVVVGRRALPTAIATAALVVLMALYGAFRLADAPPHDDGSGEHLRVAAVQGNVEQGRIWNPEERLGILQKHVDLTLDAIGEDVDLVLWPESSVPIRGGIQSDPLVRNMIGQLATQYDVTLVVASPYFAVGASGEPEVTNSAFVVSAGGEWIARYDKVRLVPWGEYVPVSWLFRFVRPLVQSVGRFRHGDPDQALFGDPQAGVPPFAMAICYEVVFPDHLRRQVARGATFLATITNDAWFGETSAPYQHFSMARMRAVETRRYLVRAANTGISGFVDPWGRVRHASPLGEQALLIDTVRPSEGTTLYVRLGDALPRLCVVLAVVGIAFYARRPPRSAGAPGSRHPNPTDLP